MEHPDEHEEGEPGYWGALVLESVHIFLGHMTSLRAGPTLGLPHHEKKLIPSNLPFLDESILSVMTLGQG